MKLEKPQDLVFWGVQSAKNVRNSQYKLSSIF